MTLGTIESLKRVPSDRAVIGLMRHAAREVIPKGTLGNEQRITKKGILDIFTLHDHLKNKLVEIYSSPVLRCIETAGHLKDISRKSVIKQSKMLGDPGVFVENSELASDFFLEFEPIEIALMLIQKSVVPGFCPSVSVAMGKLFEYMFSVSVENGIYLFITHDSILGVIAGILFPEKQLCDVWPDFLDTLFLYKEKGVIYVVYRGKISKLGSFY